MIWRCRDVTFDLSARTLVMGILNVTPDSFSDGGRYFDPDAAIARGRELFAQGADLVDLGAERTRSGAAAVPAAEQVRRLEPVLRVNLDGAFFTAQEAVKQMVAQDPQGGSVVFTTSGSALYGQQRGQHYGGSKGALIAMMKGIAVEHARHGIRCNAILPGWIESEMTAPALSWDKFVDNVLPRVPMRRWGKPADFGGMAVYLASAASGYHTGDVLTIDGGYHSF